MFLIGASHREDDVSTIYTGMSGLFLLRFILNDKVRAAKRDPVLAEITPSDVSA
jgi:hypothetical protein